MRNRNRLYALGAAAGMLILILDSKTALKGASDGINLCMRALIPSLFPFIILSILLTGALSGQAVHYLRPIAKFCKMPEGTESLIPVSMLGGYPVGAQAISLLFLQGQLSAKQAMRLLAFCNNAGPAFIFGILGTLFSSGAIAWLLWLVHILSAFLVGHLLPDMNRICNLQQQTQRIRITDALSHGIRVMALVCGWVIFTRIILAFMEVWFLRHLPKPAQVIISGLLELSNGCVRLSELESEGLRFMISSALLSLGGICVTLQTASVADGIDLKLYFPGKLLQCSISLLLSCLLQTVFPVSSRISHSNRILIIPATIIFIAVILEYSKKVVEFSGPLMYNRSINNKEVSSCFFAKK